jgi:hypothetical protein
MALALAVAACSTDPRATRLVLRTAEAGAIAGACDAAATTPFRIERDGEEMVFVDPTTAARRSIIWPFGFAAWVEFGRAVLYARDGTVVGREGDVLDNIGGSDVEDEGFRVCAVGGRTYQ